MLSNKAIKLIESTIAHTTQMENGGKVPFFTTRFWVDVLKNPKQYKKLVKEVERQANQKEVSDAR